jgi:serine phosphatase RsbU (regulator of sigma subunit)
MAALVPKLAITVMLVLAWLRAGAPIDPVALRRRLAWGFGLTLALRLAFELLMRAAPGTARNAMAFAAELAALALFWPLLRLALTGPLSRAGLVTRLAFTAVGLVVFWAADPGTSMVFFWAAFTRCAWPTALRTPERFWASVAALVAALALFFGVHRVEALSPAASAAEGIARLVRGVAIVHALYATSKAFKAFTSDPTLGIRRVSRRLVLSHVLVVGVPLAIVVTLWICSTYLGVNADRALMTVRAVDREAAQLEQSLHSALASGDATAGARALGASRQGRWPGFRVYAISGAVVRREAGARLPHDSLLAGWVAGLDSLPRHGVVEFGRQRYLGAAAVLGDSALVALEPIREALDSTLSPLVGARLSMPGSARGPGSTDSLRASLESLADSLRDQPFIGGTADTMTVARARRLAQAAGPGRPTFRRMQPGERRAVIAAGRDSIQLDDGSMNFLGLSMADGVRRDGSSWKSDDFAFSAQVSFHATLAGLFVHLRENPLQIVPVLALALLASLLLPLAGTDLQMVRGMGGSITRAIGALREGAAAFGEGKLAHRIPIAGDDDLWDTARQFNRMAEGLEHARELEKQRDRLENELDLARRIQARLLPSGPPRVAGLDVAGLSESAREVGGDYFDHLDLGDGRLLLVIADVSGKGVPAALLMSGFRAALMSQDLARATPEQLAARANEFLNKSVEPGKFVTAFLGVLDAASGRLAYVNAGHNPPVLMRATGAVEMLEAGGVILGIMPDARYASGEATLAPGDLVALYTDGVTEGADAANELWGEDRLTALLRSAAPSPARDIATRIVREVRAFEGERGPADDITVLVAKREAPRPA